MTSGAGAAARRGAPPDEQTTHESVPRRASHASGIFPPGRAFRERCDWLEGGRRHVVCRSGSRASTGEWREGVSIFSYRAADSTYLYHGFRSGGAVETLTGRATADGWDFGTEVGTGVTRQRQRVTITRLPDGGFRLVDALATGDGPFVAGDTTRHVRRAASP